MKSLLSSRTYWIGFASGSVCLVGALLLVAWLWGPRLEFLEEDPLTGRRKRTITWLGAVIHCRISENNVSRWADENSAEGVSYSMCGWSYVASTERIWFRGVEEGSGGYGIPRQIYRGDIKIGGLSREEVLREYQNELTDHWRAHESIERVLKKWRARHP